MIKKEITLAIETAVEGGSLSLLKNGSVIDHWFGEREVSRSEELIEAVSSLLQRNQLTTSDLTELAVSRGPGSYTGARIGLATALGLKNALEIKCSGVTVLDSLYNKFKNPNFEVMTAISYGKNEVCFQYYEKFYVQNAIEQISLKIETFDNFMKAFCDYRKMILVANQKLYIEIKDCRLMNSPNMINAGVFISDYIGEFTVNNFGSDNLLPVYSNLY